MDDSSRERPEDEPRAGEDAEPTPEETSGETPEKKASVDSMLRAWAGQFAADLAAFVLGEAPEGVRQADTGLGAAASRFTDKLLHCSYGDRPGKLVHLEFQGATSVDFPERMAVYIVLIQPVLRRPEHAGKSFAAAAIYLDAKRYHGDPGCFERAGQWGTRVSVSYRVIKLWEISPEVVRDSGRAGLLPLLPLMDGNPVDLLVESRKRILSLEAVSAETKNLLLTLTLGLAGLRIEDREILKRLAMEFHVTGKNTFLDVLRDMAREEIGDEVLEQGRVAQSRRDILQVLVRRFGAVSAETECEIERIRQLDVLDSLHDEAVVAPTLFDFERRLASLEG